MHFTLSLPLGDYNDGVLQHNDNTLLNKVSDPEPDLTVKKIWIQIRTLRNNRIRIRPHRIQLKIIQHKGQYHYEIII